MLQCSDLVFACQQDAALALSKVEICMGWQLVSVCIFGEGGLSFKFVNFKTLAIVTTMGLGIYLLPSSPQTDMFSFAVHSTSPPQYVYCFVVSHRVHTNKAIYLTHQVPVSRSVGMVWWRETRSVTVAPLTPPPAGRGTPVVHLAIAPSMQQLSAGEDTSTFYHYYTHCCHPPLT